MNKTIVFFDMDGTLTDPRSNFSSRSLESSLYQLTNLGVHIGIVTGSNLNYLLQQMETFLDRSPSRYKTHLLPCNGTKYLIPPQFANYKHKMVYDVSMSEHLGTEDYRKLVKEIIDLQMEISDKEIPLSGHFIDYRGSMINWSPIGRGATHDQREEFKKIDNLYNLRVNALEDLRSQLQWLGLEDRVVAKLGGDTSFDIYPTGWDKTYALKHFDGWDAWFVGDRCCADGNDYEIFNACKGQSFVTYGPEKTSEIIQQIIHKIKENK